MNDSSEEQEIGGDDNDDAMNSSSTTPKNEATAAATAPTSALEYSQGYLFGGPPKPKKELPPPRQLGEAAPETPMPVIDDDGFAPVVTKKKGARRYPVSTYNHHNHEQNLNGITPSYSILSTAK
eukprot:scaffold18624_cov113-Skeletonema_marinoi.AAC.2